MSTKVKTSRLFTFKAYIINESEEVLKDAHKGEFMLKSECHYYCEKGILDYIKSNYNNLINKSEKYLIYKISTIEDSNIKDMLIEQIYIKDGVINII